MWSRYYSLLEKPDKVISFSCKFSSGTYGRKYLKVDTSEVEDITLNINLLEANDKKKYISNCSYMDNDNSLYINILTKNQTHNLIEENLVRKVLPKNTSGCMLSEKYQVQVWENFFS